MSHNELYLRLIKSFPECSPKLTEFPSGSFMIDIKLGGEDFVIEHDREKGYGFSKVSNATYGCEGADKWFATIEEIERYTVDQLKIGRPS